MLQKEFNVPKALTAPFWKSSMTTEHPYCTHQYRLTVQYFINWEVVYKDEWRFRRYGTQENVPSSHAFVLTMSLNLFQLN